MFHNISLIYAKKFIDYTQVLPPHFMMTTLAKLKNFFVRIDCYAPKIAAQLTF